MDDSGAETAMEEERLKAILESLLFAAGEPVSLTQLANALESVPREEIRRALAEMTGRYASGNRGLMLEEIAGGYQLRTPREHALYVRRLLAARPPRLSRPLLETLAIVAYRQPITRPEIEQLRGVDSGGVLDTLTERGLLKIAGRKDAPGRPLVYATTAEFLELFGLKDLEHLPDLEEFRALEGLREPPPAENPADTPDPVAEAPAQWPSADASESVPANETSVSAQLEPAAGSEAAVEPEIQPESSDRDDDSDEPR
ncbi:MAG TPA: SMC-Scp complex subunit ScpB [Candidatus Binataceae bacterium]|nr:SMC-Scp complex subunit ScpB [Candidatus Binataceae bacterium]